MYVGTSLFTKAKTMGVELPADFKDPTGSMKPAEIIPAMRLIANHFFPLLATDPTTP